MAASPQEKQDNKQNWR